MLDEAIAFFKAKVTFAAPDCRLWSAAKRKVDAVREALERQLETPALIWLAGLFARQADQGRHYIAENPLRGCIFQISPMKKVLKIQGNVLYRVDQCQHGALHPVDKLPIKKSTALASNIKLTLTARDCRGLQPKDEVAPDRHYRRVSAQHVPRDCQRRLDYVQR